MMRNYFLIGFALLAAVMVVTVISYPYMPEMVPSHWNVHGTVDHTRARTSTSADRFGVPHISLRNPQEFGGSSLT